MVLKLGNEHAKMAKMDKIHLNPLQRRTWPKNGQKRPKNGRNFKKKSFLFIFFTKESFKDFLNRNSGPDLAFKTKSVDF